MAFTGYTQSGKNVAGQFGMPLYGINSGGLPPFQGNSFWVDGTNGSDGNTGGPQDPLKTLAQALSLCTAGNNDVVYFVNQCNQTKALAWNKNNTHLVGLAEGYYNANSALIGLASYTATTGAFSPLVNVTATGCIFQNVAAKSGIAQAATQVCWAEAGGGNTYINCSFNQVGNATAAAQAGNRALTLASTNNSFIGCTIGSDAIIRGTGTNISMEMLDGAGSSTFRQCVFPIYTSVAANTFVKTTSTALSGYFVFDGCSFINNPNGTSATTMTVGMTAATTCLATILLTPTTTVIGVTNVVAGAGAVWFSGGLIGTLAATGNQGIVGT
jgi:hypothetical protein